jgi:hypothetical protein
MQESGEGEAGSQVVTLAQRVSGVYDIAARNSDTGLHIDDLDEWDDVVLGTDAIRQELTQLDGF